MTALEVILLICGVICIGVSFLPETKEKEVSQPVVGNTDLTTQQKDVIRQQINEIVKEELADINEKTEASLDKISNTKILEMNEYADTVMNEINRNHNETVFLYDMLNEKAKEIKTTVKDVNLTKQQVEKIQAEVTVSSETEDEEAVPLEVLESKKDKTVRDDAKERLSELVRQSNEKARKQGDNSTGGHQANKLDDMVKELTVDTLTEDSSLALSEVKGVTEATGATEATAAINTTAVTAVTEATTAAGTDTQPAESVTVTSKNDSSTQTSGVDAEEFNTLGMNSAEQNMAGASNKEKILRLYHMDLSNKEIAKELNLGIGEVKLVIDLYNSMNK